MERDETDDISVSLAALVEPQLAVYFAAEAVSSIDELRAVVHTWLDRHAAPAELHRTLDSKRCVIRVGEVDRAAMPTIASATRGVTSLTTEEPARLQRATAGALVHTVGLPGDSALWTAIAASRALVESLDGVAWDAHARWLLPIASCTAPITRRFVAAEHVRVVVDQHDGQTDLVTYGARKLGVPNLVMRNIPFDFDTPILERALLETIEQHVSELWHALRETPPPARLRLSDAIDLADDVSVLLAVRQRDEAGEPTQLDVLTPPPLDWATWRERAKAVLD